MWRRKRARPMPTLVWKSNFTKRFWSESESRNADGGILWGLQKSQCYFRNVSYRSWFLFKSCPRNLLCLYQARSNFPYRETKEKQLSSQSKRRKKKRRRSEMETSQASSHAAGVAKPRPKSRAPRLRRQRRRAMLSSRRARRRRRRTNSGLDWMLWRLGQMRSRGRTISKR